jgi:DNA helicase-2/ATP-dependent DNA helicase PcrA
MVKARLKQENNRDEFQQIMEHIRNGDNFLLSGGAGSGKTYTLVQVIKQVIEENPSSKIACMTYTNSAVREIEERVNHKNLNVTTIHDFLWNNIVHFQKELKSSLVHLVNDEGVSKIEIDKPNPISKNYFDNLEKGIRYKNYLKIKEGIISHDEIIILANYMFKNFPKLCDILKDKLKFVFIDEYQDTQKEVVEIFLEHLKQSKRRNVIGFFGDAMQSIYDDGIGNLDGYKGEEEGKVKEVKKEENRRNPQLVIDLANKLRTDGLIQKPSDDRSAPNFDEDGNIKRGNVKFIYSKEGNINRVREYLAWDLDIPKETKELNLTHNLIADKAGFRTLMDIYDKDPIIGLKNDILQKIKDNKKKNKLEIEIREKDTFDEVVDKFQLKKNILLKDNNNAELYNQLKGLPFSEVRKIYLDKKSLIDDKKQDEDDIKKNRSERDNLIRHLFKIQNLIFYYCNRNFNQFLRETKYKVNHITDKKNLKNIIDSLVNVDDKSIEDIINEAHEKGICIIDDSLENFKLANKYVYNRVKDVKFSEFQKLYDYLGGYTPFSTQHKTKSSECNNVLIILDNGGWTKYNFKNLFLESGKQSVIGRTQKIFYVCCTRAKENLAVFYHNPSDRVIKKSKEWFGDDNVVDLDNI